MYKKIIIACAISVLAALLFLMSAFVVGIVSPPVVDESAAAVIKTAYPDTGSPGSRTVAEESVESPKARAMIAGTIEANGKRYAAEIEKGAVYDLMEAARSKGFVFESEYYSGLGFFITSIDGAENDPGNGRYWTLYVNGERSNLGASNYMLKSGDSIEWKLEKN